MRRQMLRIQSQPAEDTHIPRIRKVDSGLDQENAEQRLEIVRRDVLQFIEKRGPRTESNPLRNVACGLGEEGSRRRKNVRRPLHRLGRKRAHALAARRLGLLLRDFLRLLFRGHWRAVCARGSRRRSRSRLRLAVRAQLHEHGARRERRRREQCQARAQRSEKESL